MGGVPVPQLLHPSLVVLKWMGGDVFKAPAEYKVLYRTKSGVEATSQQFHAKCDGHGPTFVLIRTDTGAVFGGYAARPWQSAGGAGEAERVRGSGCYNSIVRRHSFLFSLVDSARTGPQQALIASDNTSRGAQFHHSTYGPFFGGQNLRTGSFGSDLYLSQDMRAGVLGVRNFYMYDAGCTYTNGYRESNCTNTNLGSKSPLMFTAVEVEVLYAVAY